MTAVPLILFGAWIVAATVPAILGRSRGRVARAVGLTVLGIPILGLVTWQYGPVIGFIALGIGALCLGIRPRARRSSDDDAGPGGAQPAE